MTTADRALAALPIGDLVSEIASSVGRAQAAMDAQSIHASMRLLEDGLTGRFGLRAPWYAIPEADFDLKLLLQISQSNDLLAHVAGAEQQARYELDMESASDFQLKVRRVPPEPPGTISLMSERQVVELVTRLKRVAWFLHVHAASFLALSFAPNAAPGSYDGGLWSIQLCRPAGAGVAGSGTVVAALFVVDDEAGAITAARFFESIAVPAEPVT
jgi:hypothetical protein